VLRVDQHREPGTGVVPVVPVATRRTELCEVYHWLCISESAHRGTQQYKHGQSVFVCTPILRGHPLYTMGGTLALGRSRSPQWVRGAALPVWTSGT
jgi:hypothetical protein